MAISTNMPVHEARANHSQPPRDVIHSTKDESADRTMRPIQLVTMFGLGVFTMHVPWVAWRRTRKAT